MEFVEGIFKENLTDKRARELTSRIKAEILPQLENLTKDSINAKAKQYLVEEVTADIKLIEAWSNGEIKVIKKTKYILDQGAYSINSEGKKEPIKTVMTKWVSKTGQDIRFHKVLRGTYLKQCSYPPKANIFF